MYRPVNCKKYWRWKRLQARRLKEGKEKPKKRKTHDSVTDCIDSADQPVETILKAKQPKYKRKKKKLPRLPLCPAKRISFRELVLKSIKPSMEIREYMLNPRHATCLRVTTTEVAPEIIEAAIALLNQTQDPSKTCRSGIRRKPKGKKKGRAKKKGSSRKEAGSKAIEDEDEEIDCRSICSFDSHVFLTGTKLTPKDKEEIKKFQNQAKEEGKKDGEKPE